MYQLIIRPEAQVDIQSAYDYYESCKINLGLEFIECLDKVFNKISNAPLQYQTIHKNIRRAISAKFPYAIFYFIQQNQIVVIAVLSMYQNPITWNKRSN